MIIKNHTQLITAIRDLIDYNWDKEEEDYEEHKEECGDSHIFVTIKALDKWVRSEE